MIRRSFNFFIFIAIFTLTAPFFANANPAPAEIKSAIDQKNQELQTLNKQIQETQRSLQSTQQESQSLQKEVKTIDRQIGQLNLGLKASETKIEKFGLEIRGLGYDISQTETDIQTKKKIIAGLLKEIQQRGDDSVLLTFLKNRSLSDSVFETQGLVDVDNNLFEELKAYKDLKNQLADELNQTKQKKVSQETEAEDLKNKKVIVESVKQEKQVILTQSKNKEAAYQKMLSDLGKRREEIAAEIEKMEEELRKQINPNVLPTPKTGLLAYPIGEEAHLTQGYGDTSFAKKTYKGRWHNGVDLGAPIGTPVYAAEKGKVAMTGNQDLYCPRAAYGKFIVINHENNLTTLYGHLSLQVVKEGDGVERGQLIGYSGNTGWATGPHLHFTVFARPTFEIKQSRYCGLMPIGGDLDPMKYISV